jgi:hypothetical protein
MDERRALSRTLTKAFFTSMIKHQDKQHTLFSESTTINNTDFSGLIVGLESRRHAHISRRSPKTI